MRVCISVRINVFGFVVILLCKQAVNINIKYEPGLFDFRIFSAVWQRNVFSCDSQPYNLMFDSQCFAMSQLQGHSFYVIFEGDATGLSQKDGKGLAK